MALATSRRPASNIEDETVGAGEVGRGDYASGGIPAENNSCPMIVKGGKEEMGRAVFANRRLYPLIGW